VGRQYLEFFRQIVAAREAGLERFYRRAAATPRAKLQTPELMHGG
jgi:hypothetical protein